MVRIHLSDGSFFVVHAEVHARAGVSVGDCIDSPRIESLCSQSQLTFARAKALRLIAAAPQTRRGLAGKLLARGFPEDAVRAAIARMTELGYLDDLAFAESWTRSRLAARKEGWKALYKRLLLKGVPRDIAEKAVAGLCTDEVELERARELAGSFSAASAARKLASRGFRSRTIARLLKEIRERGRAGDAE
ncbi:MAG: regulatory protein RecX [Spirochaetes bacterium]|nr:regulatory protein RecX [Spirochaetota bacterium]